MPLVFPYQLISREPSCVQGCRLFSTADRLPIGRGTLHPPRKDSESHPVVPDFVSLSFEAESSAEVLQLRWLLEKLREEKAEVYEWSDRLDCGGEGISVKIQRKK